MAFTVERLLLQPDSAGVGLSHHELWYIEGPFSDGLKVSICLCLIAICWLWFLLLLVGSSFGLVHVCMYMRGAKAEEEQGQHSHLQSAAPQIYRYSPAIVLKDLFFRIWHKVLVFPSVQLEILLISSFAMHKLPLTSQYSWWCSSGTLSLKLLDLKMVFLPTRSLRHMDKKVLQ